MTILIPLSQSFPVNSSKQIHSPGKVQKAFVVSGLIRKVIVIIFIMLLITCIILKRREDYDIVLYNA